MKVVILSAGKGSRLGACSDYFNKSFIKIGNKGAVSHIIEYFPEDTEFIFVINHLADLVKQYITISHPSIRAKFVEQKIQNGPGGALLECKKLINEPFYIWCNDTLIEKLPNETNNWIGFSKVESLDGEYSSIEIDEHSGRIYDFYEKKSAKYTGNAYIGCAFIKDYQEFFYSLEYEPIIADNQYQVSSGFQGLLRAGKPILAEKCIWHDVGNLDNLQIAREYHKGKIDNLSKIDEEIYFFDGFVVKYFYNEKIAENRAKRNLTLGDTVPKLIKAEKNFYSYEYIEGTDLFAVEHPEDYVHDLFAFMKANLWTEKKLSPEQCSKFHEACVDFYYRKTKIRIEQLFSKLHMYDHENIINGETVPKIFDMLSVINWKSLLNGIPTLMHGDFNFSNILLTDKGFKIIDWRQDFGGITEFGDMYYDLAKFYSGLLFPHDVVKNKEYEISIKDKIVNYNIKNCNSQELTEKYKKSCIRMMFGLKDLGADFKKVKQLAAIVLINMATLHESPLNILLYYMGKHELWLTLKQ